VTFDELLSTYEPKLAAAFREAIESIKSTIVLKVVVERLERGDVEGAIAAMQLDAEAFASLEIAFAEAYNAGGINEVANLPKLKDQSGARIVFRFGLRNPAAERFLREHSSQMVTRIVEDQRIAVRAALVEGLTRGKNPTATALDVIGRMSKVTRRREGGIIGLTSPQERFIAKARAELLSGDPAQLRHYLTRERRDKRFDRTVAAAIKAGKPVAPDDVTRMVGRYSDRLLQLRGEMLARTETMMALATARDHAIRQQIDAGKIAEGDVKKKWRTAGDSRVRHTHRVMNGQAVEMNGMFVSPSGATLRYPGDPEAPVSEIIGCRCFLQYKVDYLASVVRRFRAEAA
jgi:hypothetical protein